MIHKNNSHCLNLFPGSKFTTDSDMTQKLLVAFLQTTGQAEKAYRITHEIPDDEEEDEDFTGFAD